MTTSSPESGQSVPSEERPAEEIALDKSFGNWADEVSRQDAQSPEVRLGRVLTSVPRKIGEVAMRVIQNVLPSEK